MNDIIRLNNELKGINMQRMWKVVFSLMLLTITTGISSYMVSFSISQEAIWDEKLRPKSLSDNLCKAISKCDFEFVKYIIEEKHCDVNERAYDGSLPLYLVILLSNDVEKIEIAVKMADLLLQHRANPYLEDPKGISVLELFNMADRSCFNEVFAKYGFDVSRK